MNAAVIHKDDTLLDGKFNPDTAFLSDLAMKVCKISFMTVYTRLTHTRCAISMGPKNAGYWCKGQLTKSVNNNVRVYGWNRILSEHIALSNTLVSTVDHIFHDHVMLTLFRQSGISQRRRCSSKIMA